MHPKMRLQKTVWWKWRLMQEHVLREHVWMDLAMREPGKRATLTKNRQYNMPKTRCCQQRSSSPGIPPSTSTSTSHQNPKKRKNGESTLYIMMSVIQRYELTKDDSQTKERHGRHRRQHRTSVKQLMTHQ